MADKREFFNFPIDNDTRKMIDDLKERGCNMAKLLRNAVKMEQKKLVEPEMKETN